MASLMGSGLKRVGRLIGLIGVCGFVLVGQVIAQDDTHINLSDVRTHYITPLRLSSTHITVPAQRDEIPPLTQTISLEDEFGTVSLSFPEDWATLTDEALFIFANRRRLLNQGFPYQFNSGDLRGGAFAFETYDTRSSSRTLLRDVYNVFIEALTDTFEGIDFKRLENIQLEGRHLVTNLGTNREYDHLYVAIDLEEGNVGMLSVFTPSGEGEALLPTLIAIALTFQYPDTRERPNHDDDDRDTGQPPQDAPPLDDDLTDGIVAEPSTTTTTPNTDTPNTSPGAPDASTYTEILVSRDGKLTVYYPEGWATNSEDGYVELANSRRTLNRDFPYNLRNSDEFVIGVIPTESARRDEDRVLQALLEDYQEQSTNQDLDVRWGVTRARELNGRKALLVTGTAEKADQVVVVVSLGNDLYVTLVVFTAPDNTEAFIGIAETLASVVQYDPKGVPDFESSGRDA